MKDRQTLGKNTTHKEEVIEEGNHSDEEGEETGVLKQCDHTYLGMILEDNKDWLKKIKEEGVSCGGCGDMISKPFYRCKICMFQYVWCQACYSKSVEIKRKRLSKRKQYD